MWCSLGEMLPAWTVDLCTGTALSTSGKETPGDCKRNQGSVYTSVNVNLLDILRLEVLAAPSSPSRSSAGLLSPTSSTSLTSLQSTHHVPTPIPSSQPSPAAPGPCSSLLTTSSPCHLQREASLPGKPSRDQFLERSLPTLWWIPRHGAHEKHEDNG